MDPNECPVVWPTTSDIIPGYALPQHRCVLPAEHVRTTIVPLPVAAGSGTTQPHKCHCGEQLVVRDVAPQL